jgi:hypothetical protein
MMSLKLCNGLPPMQMYVPGASVSTGLFSHPLRPYIESMIGVQ